MDGVVCTAWNCSRSQLPQIVSANCPASPDCSVTKPWPPASLAAATASVAANEAATTLLAVPWELLDDGGGPLLHGKVAVGVRRRRPNRATRAVLATEPPVRILLVSPRPEDERAAYIDFLRSVRHQGTVITDVLLYGLARQSFQPEASRLGALPVDQLEAFGADIRAAGFTVSVHP